MVQSVHGKLTNVAHRFPFCNNSTRVSENIEAICDSEMKNSVQEEEQGKKTAEVLVAPSSVNSAPTSPDREYIRRFGI